MLKGVEIDDSTGPLLAAVVDGVTHRDLRSDAAVEAMVSDRLREKQQHDANQAQAADCCQHGISVRTNHLSSGKDWLLWSVMFQLRAGRPAHKRREPTES